jgi:nitrogen fixation/metabolism regulation signal transduction histidine kinase
VARSWHRRRRQNRFLVGLYLVLLALVGCGFWLFARMRGLPPEELTNRLLTFLLWWFDLTLIGILLFILARNLVKLLLERHRGMLGSRFRTKLLLSYLALILVPTGLLFVLSVSLLSQASASWFTAPVEDMARTGAALAEEVRQESEARVQRAAATVAAELARVPRDEGRLAELERLHGLLGLDFSGWFRNGVAVVELLDPRQRVALRLPPLDLAALGRSGVRSERGGGTVIVRAWESLPDGTAVVVGEVLPSALIARQARLATAGAAYERLKLERPTITATTVLGFGALALLVVFAAIWLGLYLSRSFTEPLLALVATTDRIAAGDTLEEVPLPAEDEVGLLVGSFNSMVRRVRMREEELRSAVRRLDTVLGAVRTGVLTIDAGRRVASGNPAAAALLAVPQLAVQEVPLDSLSDAGHPRLVEMVKNAAGPVRGPLTIQPGGVSRFLEVAVVPLGLAEAPAGWVVALEDLTQLMRAQRLAAWSEVARRLAHQIKNPLTPIQLAADRLARHAERGAADLAEVVAQGSRAIGRHVQTMQEMVDAFSRYAKLPPMARRPVDLRDLVSSVVSLYQDVRPGLAIRVGEAPAEAPALVDPEQIRQVLVNLLDNAVEASPPEGRIDVALRWETDEAVIEIADQGPGLEGTDSDLLFQPFYSTKGRGSGVGLALVLRIVTDHGGTVRLEPNAPRGVRAVVRLPVGDGFGQPADRR